MWHDTTLRDDNVTEELVQSEDESVKGKRQRQVDALFVVADSELKVTRDNTLLLVIAGSVASKFENFSSQVFEDGSEVD